MIAQYNRLLLVGLHKQIHTACFDIVADNYIESRDALRMYSSPHQKWNKKRHLISVLSAIHIV